ncbi:hypothetical protein HYX00_04650 [Candidatus Woesearchaeota archaeon]|nr:hypothetical protein [Candidatus Woesearchaeota archaeon]
MNKKIFGLTAFLLVFGVLFSAYAYAIDVSINRVTVNGNVVAQSRTNLINDADFFSVTVEFTALTALENAHIEAILRGLQSGNTVSDSTSTFNLGIGQSSTNLLRLALVDGLRRENQYELTIKIIDARGNSRQQAYTINTRRTAKKGLDVSIDRVRLNGQILAASRTNFINKSNFFDVAVDLTALEELENARVEVVLKDLVSGTVVADATPNFNLQSDSSTSKLLRLALFDRLRDSNSFELTVRIEDTEGNIVENIYGIRTKDGISAFGGRQSFEVSIDRVRVNGKVVAQSRTNFIDKSNSFDVSVDVTALTDLENTHIEAILRDLNSGTVVADATPNFNLQSDSSTSRLLRVELLDRLKQSNSFELTIKIIDAEGSSIQQTYGLRMRDSNGNSNGISGAGGRALDISIDSVEVGSKTLAENENNFVIIGEDKKELSLRVRLTSLEDVENAHIDAVLTFENGDVVADATTTFNIGKDQNAVKNLELPLIGKFEQNSFKLKVRVADAEGDSEEKLYGLKLSQKKFPFVISSISLSPEDNIQAGKNLVAKLSFKNSGVVPLEGINAKVSIPELGVSSTRFIDQIKNSKLTEVREDFILRVLDDVQTGTYTVRSEIASQFGGESEVKEIPVFILGKSEQTQQIVNDKLIINAPIITQDIKNDGSEVIYSLILTNEGKDANTYTLLLDGANWANLRLSESNTFVLRPKESKTINVYASTKENVLGEQIFIVAIRSNDKVLKNIPLKGNVISAVAPKGIAANLKNVLEVVLLGVAVFLAAIGFFFGVKKYLKSNSKEISEEIPDQEQGEAYY